MLSKEVGITKVKITMRRREDGQFDGRRECDVGCECAFTASYRGEPDLEKAAHGHVCFNDADGIGMSGRGAAVVVIENSPDLLSYSFGAKLTKYFVES
jgi:hypothetical protein